MAHVHSRSTAVAWALHQGSQEGRQHGGCGARPARRPAEQRRPLGCQALAAAAGGLTLLRRHHRNGKPLQLPSRQILHVAVQHLGVWGGVGWGVECGCSGLLFSFLLVVMTWWW